MAEANNQSTNPIAITGGPERLLELSSYINSLAIATQIIVMKCGLPDGPKLDTVILDLAGVIENLSLQLGAHIEMQAESRGAA